MAQSTSELTTYTDMNNGFTLQYPSDWTKDDSNTQNSSFVLSSPDSSAKVYGLILRPIPASMQEIIGDMTLDELVKSLVLPASFNLPPAELSTLGINIVELNSDGYFLSGHPAGRIVMTLPDSSGSSTATIMGLATIANDGVYLIVYKSDATMYSQNLDNAQAIIDSFKIISRQ